MKSIALALSIASLSVFASSIAHAACGQLEVSKGDVKIESGGKTSPAAAGAKICAGDTIIAGKDSRAKIKMEDGNELNVSPDSKIALETYQFVPAQNKKKVLLNILQGKVRAATKQENMYNDKSADGSDNTFQVKTKSAVAGVRGTDFLTGFDPKTNKSEVVTFKGKVEFGQPGPGGTITNSVQVGAGQKTEQLPGQPPAAPKPVPPKEMQQMNNDSKADTGGSSSSNNSGGDKKSDKKDGDKQGDAKGGDKQASGDGKGDKQGSGDKQGGGDNKQGSGDKQSGGDNKQGSTNGGGDNGGGKQAAGGGESGGDKQSSGGGDKQGSTNTSGDNKSGSGGQASSGGGSGGGASAGSGGGGSSGGDGAKRDVASTGGTSVSGGSDPKPTTAGANTDPKPAPAPGPAPGPVGSPMGLPPPPPPSMPPVMAGPPLILPPPVPVIPVVPVCQTCLDVPKGPTHLMINITVK